MLSHTVAAEALTQKPCTGRGVCACTNTNTDIKTFSHRCPALPHHSSLKDMATPVQVIMEQVNQERLESQLFRTYSLMSHYHKDHHKLIMTHSFLVTVFCTFEESKTKY